MFHPLNWWRRGEIERGPFVKFDTLPPMINWPPMGKNIMDRELEEKLLKDGWIRASQQHYAITVGGKELAIDEHIGHFCVGYYEDNRTLGDTLRFDRFAEAYAAATGLSHRSSR